MLGSQNNKMGNDMRLPMWRAEGNKSTSFTDKDLIKLLSTVTLFIGLDIKEMDFIKSILYERNYNMGEYLFRENHPASTIFIIKSGFVAVEESTSMNQPKKSYPIMLTPGDCLGELALLEDSKRPNSAYCTSNTTVLGIFRSDFFNLVRKNPTVGQKILQNFISYIDSKLVSISDELIDYRRRNSELKCELESR